jgi:hypothetical protein
MLEEEVICMKEECRRVIVDGIETNYIVSNYGKVISLRTNRALKLVKDKQMLRKMLTEDASSSSRFALNKKIISFTDIPNELSNKILECVNSTLYKNSITNHHKKLDWSQFMTL